MKILTNGAEMGERGSENLWPGADRQTTFTGVEAGTRYQPGQAGDELPHEAIAVSWPTYGHYDSPLAD
jgi:hypothetical protein